MIYAGAKMTSEVAATRVTMYVCENSLEQAAVTGLTPLVLDCARVLCRRAELPGAYGLFGTGDLGDQNLRRCTP